MKVLNWGISPTTPRHSVGHIRITNGILVSLCALSFVQTSIFVLSGAYDLAIANCSAPVIFLTALLLMRSGRTHLARMVFMLGGIIGTYWISAMSGFNAQFHLVLLLTGVFSVFIFPIENRRYIFSVFALALLAYYLLEYTGFKPLFGKPSLLTMEGARWTRITAFTISWLLFVLLIEFFSRATKRYQESLVHSAKMAALGQMAAGISHEINNPLTVLLGMSEKLTVLASRPTLEGHELASIASMIEKKALRMSAVIHGLVAFSRDSRSDPVDRIPVRKLVELTMGFCEARIRESGIALEIGDIQGDPQFIGHESEISQVLLNLINNAIDAVNGLEPQNRWVRISCSQSEKWIELTIADGGDGVSENAVPHLFEPFFTTKPVGKGTGLGLSISRSIALRHGGDLIHDRASANTRFVVRLPALL